MTSTCRLRPVEISNPHLVHLVIQPLDDWVQVDYFLCPMHLHFQWFCALFCTSFFCFGTIFWFVFPSTKGEQPILSSSVCTSIYYIKIPFLIRPIVNSCTLSLLVSLILDWNFLMMIDPLHSQMHSFGIALLKRKKISQKNISIRIEILYKTKNFQSYIIQREIWTDLRGFTCRKDIRVLFMSAKDTYFKIGLFTDLSKLLYVTLRCCYTIVGDE